MSYIVLAFLKWLLSYSDTNFKLLMSPLGFDGSLFFSLWITLNHLKCSLNRSQISKESIKKKMNGMFFKQGCSALVQDLVAKSYTNLYSAQSSYSPIFFWTLIYNLPQNELQFTVPRGNDSGHLFSTSSTFLSELFISSFKTSGL